jgi:hypothetical protein
LVYCTPHADEQSPLQSEERLLGACESLPQRLIELPWAKEDGLEAFSDRFRLKGLGAHDGVGFKGGHYGDHDSRLQIRGMLADRPNAVAAVTRIFLAEIERLLCAAAGVTIAACAPAAAHPRLGAVSFLHRFGSALNHHVHLHVCATYGVFVPAAGGAGCDASPAFLPARPINQADLAALTERVRRRVIRWFRLTRLLDTAAAADMLAWENSGFSIDASVRISLIDRDMPSYFRVLPAFQWHGSRGLRSSFPQKNKIRVL